MKKYILTLLTFALFLSLGQSASAAASTEPNGETEEKRNNPVKIGPQVFQTSALTSAAGTDDQGNTYMYFIMHGTPSALAVIDLNNDELIHTYELTHSTSAWGLDVNEDGTVWVGGTTDGHVYSYNPNNEEFIDYGNQLTNPKDTAIQDIDAAEDQIFGSTAYGGSVFLYNYKTENLKNYGQVLNKKEFAKSLVYDKENHSLFIGVGSKADLVKLDIESGKKTAFLPDEYKNDKYLRDLKIVDDYLLARMDPSNRLVIFDKNTLNKIDEIEVNSRTVSNKSPLSDVIYFSKNNALYQYDLVTKEIMDLEIPLLQGTELLQLDFVQLKEQEQYPGYTLVGQLDNDGNILKYNLETRAYEIVKLQLPSQPVTLYTMIQDEKRETLFINGYMSGGLAMYHTKTNKSTLYPKISQIESMTIMNQKLYIGAYPHSRVLELDLTKPWNEENPREIMRLGNYGQSRSTAITAVPELQQIYVGTYPETSIGGGALAVYNLKEDNYKIYENYIYNQSLISFLHHNRYIYGGTSVHANYKVNDRGARFFRFNPNNPEEKEYIHLPFKSSMITSLISDERGRIWGMGDGTLFSYDPHTKEIRSKEILELISGRFKNAKIIEGIDRNIYGTVEGKLFKADPYTLEIEILLEEGAQEIAQDDQGNLYYRDQADLWKYELSKTQ